MPHEVVAITEVSTGVTVKIVGVTDLVGVIREVRLTKDFTKDMLKDFKTDSTGEATVFKQTIVTERVEDRVATTTDVGLVIMPLDNPLDVAMRVTLVREEDLGEGMPQEAIGVRMVPIVTDDAMPEITDNSQEDC